MEDLAPASVLAYADRVDAAPTAVVVSAGAAGLDGPRRPQGRK